MLFFLTVTFIAVGISAKKLLPTTNSPYLLEDPNHTAFHNEITEFVLKLTNFEAMAAGAPSG